VQLIPLQEGELKMDIASVDNEVTFASPNDPFKTKTFSAKLNSNPLSIQVRALPEKNKPAAFSGIVGAFHISSKVDSSSIPEGENNNLHVTIEGEGNVQGIAIPYIQWPEGTEHFEGTDSQHIDKMSFPENGSTTFEIPFLGTKQGKFTIPKISFSYFDAAMQTYKTIETDNIPVTITHALAKTNKFRDIVTEDITTRKYLWIIPGIALTVGFVWILSTKKNKKPEATNRAEDAGNKTKDSSEKKQDVNNKIQDTRNEHDVTASTLQAADEKVVEALISTTKKTDFPAELQLLQNVTDNQEFFTHVKALLTLALQTKLKTTFFSETILITALQQQMNNTSLISTIETIYKVSNLSLYSPIISDDVKASSFQQLSAVIEQLDIE
jgi:hypothetical protein